MRKDPNKYTAFSTPNGGKKRWYQGRSRKIETRVFCLCLVIGMIISLIIPLRPTESAIEKRTLTKFPSFSFSSLFSGDYFSQISTWYSDTFPFREKLISLNSALTGWHGFGAKVDSIDTANDEIPEEPLTTDADSSEVTNESEPEISEESTEESTTGKPHATETLGSILVSNNAGYEYYNFVQSTADEYISMVKSVAAKMPSTTRLFDVVIPTSMDIVMDEATRASVSSSDQKKAINYFCSSIGSPTAINIFDALKEHKDEYVYFRTDHHWTALGAYYAYVEVCKQAGLTPVDIKDFEKVSYGEFLGSFYGDTGGSAKLKKGADELIAYKPNYDTSLVYTDNKGNQINWPLINDVSTYKSSYKYSAFSAGDQPFEVIKNNTISGEKSAVVIKESFGNAMIPFIVGNYKTVYVLDYRYYSGTLTGFMSNHKVDDVYLLNNISATRSATLVASMKTVYK